MDRNEALTQLVDRVNTFGAQLADLNTAVQALDSGLEDAGDTPGVAETAPLVAVPRSGEPERTATPIANIKRLKRGDYVSWSGPDDLLRGKVERVSKEGTVTVPGGTEKLEATTENPVAVVRTYADSDGKGCWSATATLTALHFNTVTRLETLKTTNQQNAHHFVVRNKTNSTGEIILYSDIGEGWFGGISSQAFDEELKALGDVKNIDVRINSGGGDVFEGVAMYNRLKAHPAYVTVYVDGIAASIASVIAMAGDEIIMYDSTSMMIHSPWSYAVGNAADMRETAEKLDHVESLLLKVYQARTDLPMQQLQDMLLAETWMDADTAYNLGFIDTVVEGNKAAASMTRQWFSHAPDKRGTSGARRMVNRQAASLRQIQARGKGKPV